MPYVPYLHPVSVQTPCLLAFDCNYTPHPLVYHGLTDDRIASYLLAHEIVRDPIATSLADYRPRVIAVGIQVKEVGVWRNLARTVKRNRSFDEQRVPANKVVH